MTNAITVVQTSVQLAPAPNTLQRTGAMISQGGTNLSPGTFELLTGPASLAGIAAAPVQISSLAWSGSVVTVTTSAPHGWTISDVIPIVIAGAAPVGYNGKFTGTITGASTLTYPLAVNPGSETTPGTVNLWAATELKQMNATFWAQQNQFISVYVLELGEGTVADGVTALTDFITAQPETFYSYLIPREWDNQTAFTSVLENYDAANAFTYFYVTTTPGTFSGYTGHKCVLCAVEAPTLTTALAGVTTAPGVTEFSLAAEWGRSLNQNPSGSSQVPPMSYGYVFGVTPWPQAGNQTTFATLRAANVGYFATGAEGGISNVIIFLGQMMDGTPWNFWYSVDWAQLNIDLNISNEVINGSNSNINPLYYNQAGINRLQNRAVQTMNQAVAFGLANGSVKSTQLDSATFQANYNSGQYVGFIVVNAEPFVPYTAANPSDYGQGIYGGLTCVYTPLRGFIQIIFELEATDLITP